MIHTFIAIFQDYMKINGIKKQLDIFVVEAYQILRKYLVLWKNG